MLRSSFAENLKPDSFGKLVFGLFFIAIGSFYSLSLPQYVQGGDTGELVAAGYRLYVAHPPGYPLWIFLQYIFTHSFQFGSVFWRASLLSSCFAFATLFLIGWPLIGSAFDLLICMPLLAFSKVFVESALLPDVFSFHVLIVALVGYLYLFLEKDSKPRQFGVPFIFCLGLSHHLTIVFLLPVVFGVLYDSRKTSQGLFSFAVGGLLGLLMAILLYVSLLMFDTESAFSWGALTGLSSVWSHFLRAEYGVFRLAVDEKTGSIDGVLYFFQSSWPGIVGLVSVMIFVISKRTVLLKDNRIWLWFGSFVLSILFLGYANITPTGMGAEVLRRFHVMPLVQLAILTGFVLSKRQLAVSERSIVGVLTGLLTVVLCFRSIVFFSLHEDSIFEDYATNLLRQANRHRPALILQENDNAYFGMRYVQAVMGMYQDVLVATPRLIFGGWYLKKLKTIAPQFALPNAENISKTARLEFERDLVEPNFKKFSVIVTNGFQDGRKFHTAFLGLGRVIGPGAGIEFESESLHDLKIRTRYDGESDGPQSFSKGLLYAEYSHYFLGRGLWSMSKGQKDSARDDWSRALDRVPYALPALQNLCRITHGTDLRCFDDNIVKVAEVGAKFF